ncbi:hypothetical protein [Rhizobacter sp. Root1221]|uniref:hypothetical protein n=1 Tax=Rhizobacter sp. Root1221 TaxID=1736433 RepID=UPI0006FDC510|nr:hypothetical protein [Rhizobacter sp. Root1221]KQV79637.1 hypothetical protein ASC87_30420 [Rhizobacter sp. Root1221]
MNYRVTLNVRHDQPQEAWEAMLKVYESMPGWIGAVDLPRWFGTEQDATHVWASVEPGGVVFEGQMEQERWERWLAELCARLSAALERPVHDAEL